MTVNVTLPSGVTLELSEADAASLGYQPDGSKTADANPAQDPIKMYLDRATLAGRRPGSLRTWRKVLRAFAVAIAPVQVVDADRSLIVAWLSRPGLSAASRRCYRSCLVGFYGWALEEGLVAADPTFRIPTVNVARGTPHPIADTDLRLALAEAPVRMRAWLLLMALAGLRCMEVTALGPDCLINTDDGVLLYLPDVKGGGTAIVPAHPKLAEVLLALPIRDGIWWNVTPHQVSKDVSSFLHDLGIEATAHSLRHYAATSWYRASGHDLLATQALLRHASVQSTQVYAQLDPRRGAEVVRSMAFDVA